MEYDLVMIGFLTTVVVRVLWWRDVIREGTFMGLHSGEVLRGLMLGIVLFIVREVLFFVSFFWSYFHSRLRPTIELGVE